MTNVIDMLTNFAACDANGKLASADEIIGN